MILSSSMEKNINYPVRKKEIEMKLPKDETLEISLPQYQPTHFWCMEENITLNVMNYNKKEVSVPEKLEGVT